VIFIRPLPLALRLLVGPELLEAVDDRVGDVRLVARPELLGEQVAVAGELDDRARHGAGDDAGAGAGGLEHHRRGAVLAAHLVGDGAGLFDRHVDQVAPGDVLALLDRDRHFLGLAEAEADAAVAIADDDHGAEAEAAAALVRLRRAADEDDLVFEIGVSHQNSRPPSRAPSASALTRPW
jgi:hypothetical protein